MWGKILPVCLGLSLLAASGQAAPYMEAQGMYVHAPDSELELGGLQTDMDFDSGYGAAGAVGNDFGFTRLELELAYRANDIDGFGFRDMTIAAGGDGTALSLMLNGFYDFPLEVTRSPVAPYVGVGIGGAYLDIEDLMIDGSRAGDTDEIAFAYQFALGISCEAGRHLALDLSYRYFATVEPEFDGVEAEYRTHNLLAGARITF